jgi:hypothetical protein
MAHQLNDRIIAYQLNEHVIVRYRRQLCQHRTQQSCAISLALVALEALREVVQQRSVNGRIDPDI